MSETMQAFFFGTSFGESMKNTGLYGFAIPDLGIVFRGRHNGSIYECQYVGLLALLKFIEANHKQLNGYNFEVLTDSSLIVYQISHRKIMTPGLTQYYDTAVDYKDRIDYRISWVPRDQNIAIVGLDDVPTFRLDLELKLDLDPINDNQGMRRN
jgi:hypothetical protein